MSGTTRRRGNKAGSRPATPPGFTLIYPSGLPARHRPPACPTMSGEPIRVEFHNGLRDRRGAVHGGSFLRKRRIALNCTRAELPRILVHELFHFVWVRLGNPVRRSYLTLLKREWSERARGELGWSAELRKARLKRPAAAKVRAHQWRDYACESFCDTAAWLYSGLRRHPEFKLAERRRKRRAEWFRVTFSSGSIPI